MSKAIIERLEKSIREAVDCQVGENLAGADLISVAGEALGYIRAYADFNLNELAYDLARVAAGGGWVPDDFDQKANRGTTVQQVEQES